MICTRYCHIALSSLILQALAASYVKRNQSTVDNEGVWDRKTIANGGLLGVTKLFLSQRFLRAWYFWSCTHTVTAIANLWTLGFHMSPKWNHFHSDPPTKEKLLLLFVCDFEGFLPHKKGRKTRLDYLATLAYTFVLYESPHRLVKCLKQLAEHLGGNRMACVCRELTKIHEEIMRDTLDNLIKYYDVEKKVRGEIVLVVKGKN